MRGRGNKGQDKNTTRESDLSVLYLAFKCNIYDQFCYCPRAVNNSY